MDQRWTKIRELFRAALDVDVKQREAFLIEQCPDDPDIRTRVASMLMAYDNDDTFLESPIPDLGQRFASKKGHESLVGTKVGSYEIKRVIAQGGMGVVFEAFDVKLEKRVALKMMNPALMQDMAFKLRFEQEAKTLAKLEDPHFVQVYALIEENHNTFIVMEYIQGITLADHIRSKGKLDEREVAAIGMQLLSALSKAHKQDIIHRDLKPSNIMLTRTDDGKPLVKVLDFGIAKNIQKAGHVTRTIGAVGTLYYMSPEQVRALKNIDHRTDIYSLGVTLYEALHGALPFDITRDEFAIRKQIVEGKLHNTSLADEISNTPVQQVLATALQIEPNARYQSADEMRQGLRALMQLEHPPVRHEAEPLVFGEPVKKKNRIARLVLPVIALLILVPVVMYAMSGSLPFIKQAPEQASLSPAELSAADDTTSGFTLPQGDSLISNEDVSIPEQDVSSLSSPLASSTQQLAEDTTSEASIPEGETVASPEPEANLVENTLPLPALADSLLSETQDSLANIENTEDIQAPASSTITLSVSPPSALEVNGEERGEVIVAPITLAGNEMHRLIVENDDYGTWECWLFIPAGQSLERTLLFDTSISIPVVAMQPDSTLIRNASISLDGTPTGAQTPMAIKVSPGLRNIEAQLDGYTQEDIRIEGADGCFAIIGSRINFDNNIDYRDKRVIVVLSKNNE